MADGQVLFQAKNFGKSYGNKQVLNNVNFTIKPGQVVGLLGRNGAGKTTLLKSMCGIHGYDNGSLTFNGEEIKETPGVTSGFGVLIESNFLNYLSAYENLKILLWVDGQDNSEKIDNMIDEVLDIVELSAVKDKKVKTFSYGMKQRLGLAQALITSRDFTVLDEPFLGLDPVGKGIVKNAILDQARKGRSIVLSSHDLGDVAEICDHILLIEDGTIGYDGPMYKKTEIIISVDRMMDIPNGTFKDLGIVDNKIYFLPHQTNEINELMKLIVNSDANILHIETREKALTDMFEKGE